jgi:hypothetical protein
VGAPGYGAATWRTEEDNVTDKLEDVWTTRDFPVLRDVTQRLDRGEHFIPFETIAESSGLEVEAVRLAMRALERRGLVEVRWNWGNGGHVQNVAGEAYLLTGLHPSADDAVTAFVEALRQAADRVDDPDEKSRLRRLADGALGITTDVLGAVLGAVTTKAMGM